MADKGGASGLNPEGSELDVLVEEILAKEEAFNEGIFSDLVSKKRKWELGKENADGISFKGDGKFEGNSKEDGRLWWR